MTINNTLKNEELRLKSLRRLEVLDSLPEQEFDDIVSLISEVCEVPIALISLVDEKRQWFKSKFGLDVTETPRELAFCAHAIVNEDVFIVQDAQKDKRFQDNPLVTNDPKIRFYAGAPLRSLDGFNLGTLCVIDRKPRELTQRQLDTLVLLSKQVVSLLELRLRLKEAERNEKRSSFLAAIPEAMSEGVVLQDSEGRIVDFNQAATKILGLSRDQLLGLTSFDPR